MNKYNFSSSYRIYAFVFLGLIIGICAVLLVLFSSVSQYVLLAPPINATFLNQCQTINVTGYYVLNSSISFNTTNCFIIYSNDTILDGLSSYMVTGNGVAGSNAVYVGAFNVTILNLNITNVSIGIYSNGFDRLNILGNSISLTSVGVNVTTGANSNISGNTISYSSIAGMSVAGAVNSSIINNRITNTSGLTGMGLISVSSSLIANNFFSNNPTHLILFYSTNNNFIGNNYLVAAYGSIAVFYSPIGVNSFSNELITSSGLTGMTMYSSFAEIDLTNVSFFGITSGDIDFKNSPGNILSLTDTKINGYSFNSTLLNIRSKLNGGINFSRGVNATGTNLSNDVRLSFNYADVESQTQPALNIPATIQFEGISTNILNATIYRNGVVCPSTICLAQTSLNAGTVVFNVTGWSNYSIGAAIPSAPTMTVTEPDQNDNYYTSIFPVTFIIDLSQTGNAWFSLTNGSINTSMNSTNNISFTYSQSILSVGNYTFTAYSQFNGGTILTSNVNFKVTSSPVNNSFGFGIGGGSGSWSNTINNNSVIQNTTSNVTPLYIPPSSNNSLVFKNITKNNKKESSLTNNSLLYWLIVGVLIVSLILIIVLIVNSMRSNGQNNQTPVVVESIVSRLR